MIRRAVRAARTALCLCLPFVLAGTLRASHAPEPVTAAAAAARAPVQAAQGQEVVVKYVRLEAVATMLAFSGGEFPAQLLKLTGGERPEPGKLIVYVAGHVQRDGSLAPVAWAWQYQTGPLSVFISGWIDL